MNARDSYGEREAPLLHGIRSPGDRGDRRIGEGRSHVETDLIHTFGPCDFEVDTTNAVPSAVAASVLAA
jgi:chloramphenicol 3-O-phosphotransferase